MTNHAELAKQLFFKGYNCAQSVFCAYTDVTGYDIDTSARMASSFGAGLGRLRETCGVVSAAALVLGIVKGYDDPADYHGNMTRLRITKRTIQRNRT